jgi:hypothetical protein
MINIRKKIKDTLTKYGHHIVYIRRDERFRCTCYVERSGESEADCPLCFGTGFKVSPEKVLVRRTISSIPETLAGTNTVQQAGSLAAKAYTYYFEHDIKPKQSDIILEVIWDNNGIPRYIKEKMFVTSTVEQLGYKGRIEFYQVYCRYDKKGVHDDAALSKH